MFTDYSRNIRNPFQGQKLATKWGWSVTLLPKIRQVEPILEPICGPKWGCFIDTFWRSVFAYRTVAESQNSTCGSGFDIWGNTWFQCIKWLILDGFGTWLLNPKSQFFLVVNSVNSLFLLLKFQNRPHFAISKQSEDKDIVDPLAELCGPVAIPPPRELMVRWVGKDDLKRRVWIYGFVRVTPTRIIIIGTWVFWEVQQRYTLSNAYPYMIYAACHMSRKHRKHVSKPAEDKFGSASKETDNLRDFVEEKETSQWLSSKWHSKHF